MTWGGGRGRYGYLGGFTLWTSFSNSSSTASEGVQYSIFFSLFFSPLDEKKSRQSILETGGQLPAEERTENWDRSVFSSSVAEFVTCFSAKSQS